MAPAYSDGYEIRELKRCFVVLFSYPGKRPIYYGNVWANRDATEYEVERTAKADMLKFLPEGFVISQIETGMLGWIHPDETASHKPERTT